MIGEPPGAVVGIYVEGVLGEADDGRPEKLTAEGVDEAVIDESLLTARRPDGHAVSGAVDVGYLAFHTADADRAQYVVEGHPDRSQIRFVVSHADTWKAS